jgi:hypothetical protein
MEQLVSPLSLDAALSWKVQERWVKERETRLGFLDIVVWDRRFA